MLAFNLNAWQGFPVFFLTILFSLAYQHHIIGKLIRSHTRWYFIEWWCDQKMCFFIGNVAYSYIPFTKRYFWYHVLRAWYNPCSAMGSNMELNLCWMHDSVDFVGLVVCFAKQIFPFFFCFSRFLQFLFLICCPLVHSLCTRCTRVFPFWYQYILLLIQKKKKNAW